MKNNKDTYRALAISALKVSKGDYVVKQEVECSYLSEKDRKTPLDSGSSVTPDDLLEIYKEKERVIDDAVAWLKSLELE